MLHAARVQPVHDIPPPRRERNAAETRQRILRSAEVEFAKKGYDGARLGQIARAAEVQQALIHHYFQDKEGLYRAVIEHAMGALTLQGWDVLRGLAMSSDLGADVPKVVEAFVDLLMRQSVNHATVFAIFRHAAAAEQDEIGDGPEALVRKIMREKAKPVFDAVVALIEDMRDKGHIRADVNAPHLCISVLSLTYGAVQEDEMVRAVWGVDPRSPEFLRQRKKEIVATVLARVVNVAGTRTPAAANPGAADADSTQPA